MLQQVRPLIIEYTERRSALQKSGDYCTFNHHSTVIRAFSLSLGQDHSATNQPTIQPTNQQSVTSGVRRNSLSFLNLLLNSLQFVKNGLSLVFNGMGPRFEDVSATTSQLIQHVSLMENGKCITLLIKIYVVVYCYILSL